MSVRTAASNDDLHFVVHKHAASRLHYDFRLELGGTLKSWAIPRGPSLVAGDKRLAVRVADHALDYRTFEGTIAEGGYGAGAVIVWDAGTWRPDGDAHAALEAGRLGFSLSGEKLSGHWSLVRMKRGAEGRGENWLIVKSRDEAARLADAPDVLAEEPRSVISGRTIEELGVGPR